MVVLSALVIFFMATIDDFHAIEMKVGTILVAEFIEGADKLLRLEVDFGEEKPRQILSGIRESYDPVDLIGKQCPFVTNLEPRTLRGFVSHGMIVATKTTEGGVALFHPDKAVPLGSALS